MYKLILGTGTGFYESADEQIKTFASVGWDGFFTGWTSREDCECYAALADKLGVMYHSVHAPIGDIYKIWESESEGESCVDEQIECMRAAKHAGVDLVIQHAIIGMERSTPTALGLKRFERIFSEAERLNLTVALENTEGEMYLEALMREFGSSEYVRFCIDTGHEMCYNFCRDLIGKYGKKLVSTHLNDNMKQTGESITWCDDSHLLPFDGLADWEKIASRLKSVDYRGELTFELTVKNKPGRNTHDRYAGLDLKGFAELALERAEKFRKMMTDELA